MQHLTTTQQALHTALITFIFTCILDDEKARQSEWNEIVSLYGERVLPALKDISHHAGECRIIRAEARRSGAAMDRERYDHHMTVAKSLACGACEDW